MTTHTPGPWSLSGDIIVGAPQPYPNPKAQPMGRVVAKLCWDFNGDRSRNGDLPWSIAEANGLLIASAPKMLANLEEIARYCELYAKADNVAGRLYSIAMEAVRPARGEAA